MQKIYQLIQNISRLDFIIIEHYLYYMTNSVNEFKRLISLIKRLKSVKYRQFLNIINTINYNDIKTLIQAIKFTIDFLY